MYYGGEVGDLLCGVGPPLPLFHVFLGSNSGCQACVAAPSLPGHLASSSGEAFRAQGHPQQTTSQDARRSLCLHISFPLGPTGCTCAKCEQHRQHSAQRQVKEEESPEPLQPPPKGSPLEYFSFWVNMTALPQEGRFGSEC